MKTNTAVVSAVSVFLLVMAWISALHAQDIAFSSAVPETGTFYVLRDAPFTAAGRLTPLPYPPKQGVFYQVSEQRSDVFLVDCRVLAQADAELSAALVSLKARIMAATSARETASEDSSLLSVEAATLSGGGLEANTTEGWDGGNTGYDYPSNTLYLELATITNQTAWLIAHGTVAGTMYAILSKESLDLGDWVLEGSPLEGMDNQTPVAIGLGVRTNSLFFQAVSLADSDLDGMPDYWELDSGLNPNDSSDASADPDGDGFSNLDEYLLGQDPHSTDPPLSTITIAVTDSIAREPNNSGTIKLTRDGTTTKVLQVYYTTRGQAKAGRDYQALGDSAIFDIGQSNAFLQVLTLDDDEYEDDESVVVQLLPGMNYLTTETNTVSLTITDNDLPPVKVSASTDVVIEGSGTNGTFRFYRDGDTRHLLTVNFTLTGTATNGLIYQTLPTSITFAPDCDFTNLTVVPINNTNYSGISTGIVTLLPNAAYRIETNAGSDELVFEDDDLPIVNVAATDADAREAGLNPGRFTVSRTGVTRDELLVNYRISGTAEMGCTTNYPGDYQYLTNAVTIPAGQSNAFIDVIPRQDTNSELMELVILTLAGGEDYRIGASNSAAVNIDDDEPLSYRVTVERPSIWDMLGSSLNRPGVIKISRTGSALSAASHTWSVTDTNGTPVNGYYFTVTGDFPYGDLYFGTNRSTATVNFQHRNSGATKLQFRSAGQVATVPCWGPDRLVYVVEDTIREYAIEGDSASKARFTVYRAANGGQLTVNLWLDGTAMPGVDYPLTNLPAVTFSTGTSSKIVDVFANPDTVTEGWDSLIVGIDTSDLSCAAFNWNVAPTNYQETYAVLWLRESGTTGPRPEVDTDYDLLTDAFEKAHGLNPLAPDDVETDADKDGLNLLEEQAAGSDPSLPDTDGDGVNDFFELCRGSNPTNALDCALKPERTVKVACVVGDDSGSVSERWQLTVGGFTANNAVPGTVVNRELTLKEGTSNLVRLRHLSSILAPPDLDYHIELRSGDATPPAFFVRDPQQLLGLHFNPGDGPEYTNKTAAVIVPKIELTWTNKGDNLPLDMNTNGFNGEVRGNRVFVGAKTPSENLPRNTVMLRIKTTPPLAGSNVWLRAFDVDDTTDDRGFDNKGIIDNNSRAGADNFNDYLHTPQTGQFVTNGFATNRVTLNASGEALVEFRVGMQPGNNYRIAATVFPTNNLNTLQSSNAAGNGYVSAYTDKVRTGFNGALSPLLTVWRKLHLEIDSMQAVATNGSEANITSARIRFVLPNKPKAGQSTVVMELSDAPKQPNELENGVLKINGVASNHTIKASQVLPTGSLFADYKHTLIVDGMVPANVTNAVCTFTDDDDHYLQQLGLLPLSQYSPLPRDQLSDDTVQGVRRCYTPAFIEIVNANLVSGLNPRTQIPFRLTAGVGLLDGNGGIFNNAKDLYDSQLFWAHTLVFGYQPDTSSDADPSTERPEEGVTAKREGFYVGGVSAVFVESVREVTGSVLAGGTPVPYKQANYYGRLYGTAAHEIGHAPGDQTAAEDHAEQGLMHEDGIGLSSTPELEVEAVTVKRFRNTQRWSE